MRLHSSPILGLACMGAILAMDTRLDCKDVAASGLLDALWFSASVAVNQANTQAAIDAALDQQAGQGQPGADGAPGINCWDLNGNGADDPEEDVNGDGVWDALDCQGTPGADGQDGRPGIPGAPGADGQDGLDGQDGVDGRDGTDGTDGADGADGQDLTGVIARGVIPGADIPDPGEPDYIPDPSASFGLLRVYRPDDGSGLPTRGRYRVVLQLPEQEQPYTGEELTVLVSVEAVHTDGGEPGSGGATAQAFGFWELVAIDDAASTAEIEVMVRTAPLNFFTDATFSLIALVP